MTDTLVTLIQLVIGWAPILWAFYICVTLSKSLTKVPFHSGFGSCPKTGEHHKLKWSETWRTENMWTCIECKQGFLDTTTPD